MKICTKCLKSKELTEFYRQAKSPDGYQYWCKSCQREKDIWRDKRQDQRTSGVSRAAYDKLLIEQDGKCKICGTTEPGANYSFFPIDHSHHTGLVRGLLCNSCNIGLSKFKDDPEIMSRAVAYLRSAPPDPQLYYHKPKS